MAMVKLPALREPEVSHRTPRTLGIHVGKSDQAGPFQTSCDPIRK